MSAFDYKVIMRRLILNAREQRFGHILELSEGQRIELPEYSLETSLMIRSVEEFLARMDKDGWELVSFFSQALETTYIFRRPHGDDIV